MDLLIRNYRNRTRIRHWYSLKRYQYKNLLLLSSRFWPNIDDAIRKAALENNVKVKLLISWWKHSSPAEDHFLRSLTDLSQAYPKVDLQVVSISFIVGKVLCVVQSSSFYMSFISGHEGMLVARPYVTLTRFICVLVIDFLSYLSELLKVSL